MKNIYCKCGCGEKVKAGNTYILGHNNHFEKGHKINMGRVPWNKNLTKEIDERITKYGKSQSKTKKKLYKEGKLKVWNKELTKETDKRVLKSSQHYPKNRKSPIYSRKELLRRKKHWNGKNNPRFNKNKTKFEKYKIKCKFNFDLGNFPEEFELAKVKKMFHPIKNKNGYTRDHIFSIYDGFINDIAYSIIKHPANCKLMLHRENSRKNKWSTIKIEKLIDKIKKWEKKYGKYN